MPFTSADFLMTQEISSGSFLPFHCLKSGYRKFIDEEKLNAVGYFIHSGKDAVIPLCHINGQMVSCDGHTRMMAAFLKGSETVLSYEVPSEDYLREFVREAQNRNIHTVADLQILSHETYEKKWIGFCDSFFEIVSGLIAQDHFLTVFHP